MSSSTEMKIFLSEAVKQGTSNHLSTQEFVIKFSNEENYHTKAGELHSFVVSFLQTSPDEDPEEEKRLFCDVVAMVPQVFAVLTQFSNLGDYNQSDREAKSLNLQTAGLCLKTLLLCHNHPKTHDEIKSVLLTTLTVLFQSYTHCKESENLYGDLLEDFTDELAGFFNSTQDVQAAMLLEFDHLFASDVADSDPPSIISISNDMGKLCVLVFTLDTVLAANLWRTFIKLISRYSSLLQEELEVDFILSALISNIVVTVGEYKLKLESKELIEESAVKILLFQINLVMKIFQAFCGSVNENMQQIGSLTVELFNLLVVCHIPSLKEETNALVLQKALICTLPPMVSLFFSNSKFLTYALEVNSQDASCGKQIASVLLKLTALDRILLNKDCINVRHNKEIFQNVLQALQHNTADDDLKLTSVKLSPKLFSTKKVLNDEKNRDFTVYDHAYFMLYEYSKTISDTEFEGLESHLVEALLSSSELVSLLIADVWMHRLRSSSVQNLYSHCVKISQKVLHLSSNRLKLFLKRMIKFLPSVEKKSLFDGNKNLELFLYEPHKILHRYGIPQLIQVSASNANSTLHQSLSLLIHELKSISSNDVQQLTSKACQILELFSLLINVEQITDIYKFCEFAKLIFKTGIYDVQIAVLTYLKAFNGKLLPEHDLEFRKVSSSLAALLAETLRSKNYIVRHEALSTYTSLAQSTPHPKIVQQAVTLAPDSVQGLKSFFAKVPLTGELTEKERYELFEKQLSNATIENSPVILSDETKQILFQLLPS